jgi:hypothetical protein
VTVPQGNNGYEVLGVAFGEDAVFIEFADVDKQGEFFSEKITLIASREKFKEDIELLELNVRDLINEAYSSKNV